MNETPEIETGAPYCSTHDTWHADGCPADGDHRTDREILLSIEESMNQVREYAANAAAQVQPLMDSLTNNPMLRMLLGGGK